MGFYGNITNTANTTFSFDIVYSTRLALDANCDTDGVFLGRYVLVDYDDQEVIKAYFIEGQFYNKPRPNLEGDKADIPLTPRLGVIYQALNVTSDTGDLMFYKWNKDTRQYQVITAADSVETPYVSNFRADVETYGRGYDSTVWVKHYDPAKNKYQYVMVAELNAAVPTFHLVTDPPTPLPTTPYIDRDTTNLDYYLHQQSNYGFRVNAVKTVNEETDPKDALYNEDDVGYSDEKVTRNTIEYTVNNSGYQDFGTKSENVWLDIFYNNKGFQEDIHTNITDLKDEIGYSFSSSGRKYGNLPLPNSAITADDTIDWHIRLPGIGNAICRMWDRFYGNRADNKRYLNFAQKREDTESNLVTYDQNTVIGIINTARDMLGYYFLPISALSKAKDENKEVISKTDVLGEKAVSYTVPVALEYKKGNVSKDQMIDYPILKCLYYKSATEKEPIKYYHYVYTPTHDPIGADVDPEELDKTINYYYYDENTKIYHIANPEAYNYDNANNVKIKTVYYTRTDGWTLTEIEQGDNLFENSIYGLITEIHTLLGTDTKDTRDLNNLQGCINIIRDIVESLNLTPGKLLYTNEKGQIATSDTYFPSAKWDADEVLAGDGKWVSRFSQVTILKNSENANQDESKVNNIVNGVEDEDIVATVLISDNDKTNDGGTEIVQNNKHTANNLTFGTRNKWIKLYGDPEDDSLEFKHQESPIITRLRAEESTGSTYVKMHNTIQDDEGKENIKVTVHGNVDIYDATGYGNFSAVEDIENHIAEIKVEPTTDNLSYDSKNPDANDNRLTIPYLTVDNAGHVVELGTKNFNIPHGFKKIKTTIIEDTDESDSSDKSGISIAESISDTLELAPQNRWIDIATVVDNNDEGSAKDNSAEDPKADKITFGHRLVPTLEENVALNGDRRTSGNEIPNVYRYGLPQDKSISDLDEDFGGYDENGSKIIDTTLMREAANTFNVPYIEVDMAGHVVAAETHTVQLPENYTTIKVSAESTDTGTGSTDGIEGDTFDSLAGEKILTAKTLTETLVFEPSNKWIRLKGTDTKGLDTITIGHEIHNIIATTGNEDLDLVTDVTNDTRTQKETFDTQIVRWDNAGHITGYETKTWTLPDSFHNIVVGEASTGTGDGASGDGTLIADTTFDSFSITPSNKWIRLKGDPENDNIDIGHLVQNITTPTDTIYLSNGINYNTHEFSYDEAGHITEKKVVTYYLPEHIVGNKWIVIENTKEENKQNTIKYSHLTQGTAKSYGTDVTFSEFGGKVDLQGYETDEAGHVIAYPTYTLTLPKGFYTPDDNTEHNGARVITGIGFTASSGEITSTSKNVGALTLVGYGDETTTISTGSTINGAFAALDNRIDNLTIKINETSLKAKTGKDILTIDSNDGIILEPSTENNSFAINHKSGAVESIDSNTLYKFNLDTYGHISEITKATAADVGLGNVANESKATMFTNPTFTGVPTAPTAVEGTNTIQIATTAFVANAVNKVAWAANYTDFDAVYNAVKAKLEEEYTLVPKG